MSRLQAWILMILFQYGPSYGYKISNDIDTESLGTVAVGDPVMYRNLRAMLNLGWIEKYKKDNQRIYYKITERGEAALALEISGYQALVQLYG